MTTPTKEQIVALAKEAGIPFNDCGATLVYRDEFFKFATLLLAQQKAEPVIGVRFYAHKSPATGLWCVSFDGDGSRYDLEEYDTEAEAIKFIDSCRPKEPANV